MPFFSKKKNSDELPQVSVTNGELDNMEPKERESYIARRINELAVMLERLNLSEYLRYLDQPWHMFRKNFMAGLSKGFGMAIGFVLLSAIAVAILQRIAASNLPWISEFLAEIIKSVQVKM